MLNQLNCLGTVFIGDL